MRILVYIYLALMLVFGLIWLTYFASSYILQNFFADNGEAYMKGPGHILQEDFEWGIVVISLRRFVIPFIVIFTFLFAIDTKEEVKNVSVYLFMFGTGLVLIFMPWLCIKIYDMIYLDWDGRNRVIEIAMKWLLPYLALLIAYFLRMNIKAANFVLTD